LSKDLSMAMLYDFYGELLTPKQAKAIDLYYNEDLSLAEIAEPLGISRQGVRDAIKRGEKLLLSMEERLGLVNRFLNVGDRMEDILQDVVSMRRYESTYVHSKPLCDGLKKLEEKLRLVTGEL